MKFGNNIDLARNEVQNAVRQRLSAPPSNPVAGLSYFDTTLGISREYNGSAWIDLHAVGGGGTTDHSSLSNLGNDDHTQYLNSVRHAGITGNPHGVNASEVGLGNVDNTSDSDKPVSTAQQALFDAKADLVGGLIPASQLPGFVDDVIEVADFASLPVAGESGKIYITLDDNAQYRWTGSQYVAVGESLDGASIKALLFALADTNNLNDALLAKINSAPGKNATTITGTGEATSFPFLHGLNTTDICVDVYELTTNEKIITDVQISANNEINVIFGIAPANGDQYRIIVIG